MPSFFCFIPMEPKPKGRPRFSKASGVAYTPKETRSAEAELRWHIEKELRTNHQGLKDGEVLFEGALTAILQFKCSRPASVRRLFHTVKPDLDNLVKLVFDALNKRVFRDDSQITEMRVSKEYTFGRPSVNIQICEICPNEKNTLKKEKESGTN